ncbi:MAG: hypothetical protein H7A46_00895 [Verrucomicrobiales bacterium]|nr:hypothetical protein [Verrucomicrobiales bacterium]
MHDEIGSSLGQIRLLGELAHKFERRHSDSEGLARQIANLAHASSQSLRQIIWSLNPNRSSYDDLLDYLPAVASDSLAGTPVELTVLKVSDNGRGFEPAEIPEASFGLQSLKDRVEGRHGSLQVESSPGKGTRITIQLPLT